MKNLIRRKVTNSSLKPRDIILFENDAVKIESIGGAGEGWLNVYGYAVTFVISGSNFVPQRGLFSGRSFKLRKKGTSIKIQK